jgi:hypothetical protein
MLLNQCHRLVDRWRLASLWCQRLAPDGCPAAAASPSTCLCVPMICSKAKLAGKTSELPGVDWHDQGRLMRYLALQKGRLRICSAFDGARSPLPFPRRPG